jgi:mannosyltransferase
VGFIVVAGLRHLGRASLWIDEGASAAPITGTRSDLAHALAVEPNFALYHLLLRPWGLVVKSEAGLRLPSLVFAVLTVVAAHAVARRLFGPCAAGCAAVLTAANGFFIGYAREARPYALFALSTTVAMLCLLRALEKPHGRRWLLWSLAALAAVLTHPIALGVVGAQLAILVLSRRHVPWGEVLHQSQESIIVVVLGAGLLLAIGPSRLRWVPKPDRRVALGVSQAVAGGPRPLTAAGVLVALLVVMVVVARRRGEKVTAPFTFAWSAAAALIWLLVPLAAVLAVSAQQSLFLPRYLVFEVPALAVVGGAALARLTLPLTIAGTALVVALLLPSAWHPAVRPPQDWRGAIRAIGADAQPGDRVIALIYGRKVTEYYLSRGLAPKATQLSDFALFAMSPDDAGCLGRVWVLTSLGANANQAAHLLGASHTVADQRSFVGVRLTLFVPDPAEVPKTCASVGS